MLGEYRESINHQLERYLEKTEKMRQKNQKRTGKVLEKYLKIPEKCPERARKIPKVLRKYQEDASKVPGKNPHAFQTIKFLILSNVPFDMSTSMPNILALKNDVLKKLKISKYLP